MKLTFPHLRRAAAALLLLALAGCASVNTVEPANPQGVANKIPDKRIITDNSLNDIAYVVEVDGARTADGLPRVQVMLQNNKAAVKNVNYRFTWFDAQRIQLYQEPYHPVSIEGGASQAIQSTATNAQAVDWKLELSSSVGYMPGIPPR
ncbi:MAG TPA: YcfL family protein [Opitutales bacterium]|jgi:uncharacterized protein YcfL|nr:YcfL family protein [Opitutales bacterium]